MSMVRPFLTIFSFLAAAAMSSGQSVPAPPAPITVTPGNQEVWVAWGASSGAAGYNVYATTTGTYTKIASNVTTLAYIQTGLTNGVDYSYYVTAVNSAGESLPSLQIDATPNPPNTYLPSFTPAGVTNAASFTQGATPGSIATIFGTHLSVNLIGLRTAAQLPLPTTLYHVSVMIGSVLAPLFAVDKDNDTGSEQINLQIPWQFAGQASVPVTINNGATISAAVTVPLTAVQPGIFLLDAQKDGFLHGDNSVVNTARPAQPGEELVAYLTGMGAVSNPPPSGSAGPGNTSSTAVVKVGDATAEVKFSGLSPQFVGLYQVNFVVPPGTASGTQTVTISMDGVASNSANLPVQ
jgi:uncharacterized protein (TIGR03437 family)